MRTKTTDLELETGFALLIISYHFDDFVTPFGAVPRAVLDDFDLFVEVTGRSISATAGLTDSQRDHFKQLAIAHISGLKYAADE